MNPHSSLAHGLHLYEEGRLREAEQLCRQALTSWPDSPEFFFLTGIVATRAERLGAAEAAFRRLCYLRPEMVEAHANHAEILYRQSRASEALDPLRRVVALDPGNQGATLRLAEILANRGEPEAGIASLEAALRCAPQVEAYHLTLARLRAGTGRADAAIAGLEQGLDQFPASAAMREHALALCRDQAYQAMRTGDIGTAEHALDRAQALLERAPVMTQALYDLLLPLIRLALLIGVPNRAVAFTALRCRFDFHGVPPTAITIFPVRVLDFPAWCEAASLTWKFLPAEPQPLSPNIAASYPGFLSETIATLRRPEVAAVALGAEIEILQGFYVKDNYEVHVLAGRRFALRENRETEVRGAAVPLIGTTRGTEAGIVRLPQPLYPVITVEEPCLFLPATPNYWHFLVDILPRLAVRAHLPETRNLPIHLFGLRDFHYEMLALAGVPRERVVDHRRSVAGPRVHYRFARATLPGPVPYPIAVRWLRDTLLPQAQPMPDAPRRIYLSRRGSAPKHRITNDAAVSAHLAHLGFTTLQPERLGVRETVALVAGADIVVAPIGAATGNQVFLAPHACWVHLANPDFYHPDSAWNAQMGVQIPLVGTSMHLTSDFAADTLPDALLDRLDVPIEVDLAALNALLLSILAGGRP